MTQSPAAPSNPRSAAQRQADRRRRLQLDGDHRRLNLWLDSAAGAALRRLARRDCVTQAQVLTLLIHRADDAVIATLDETKPEWDRYFLGGCAAPTNPKKGAATP